jgi:hypothetical protein
VVAASAGTIVGQTIFPTAVGFALLGDDTREGFHPLAVAGFAVALLGALLLARFGNLSEDTRTESHDPPSKAPQLEENSSTTSDDHRGRSTSASSGAIPKPGRQGSRSEVEEQP